MNLRYWLGALIAFPLLPLMYYQGKRIRSSVPKLPEAKGAQGRVRLGESRKSLRILALGESTLAGVGVKTHEEGFTGTFARAIGEQFSVNIDWKVYARSGYTANRVVKKLVPKITESPVDLYVIGLGGNDAFTLNRPSKWRSDIHALIQSLTAKNPEAIIVFCNMPPIKAFPAFTPLIKFIVGNLVEILGQELKKVCSQYEHVFYNEAVISLNSWMDKFQLKAKIEDFFSDGVHPSKLTYQTWARAMVDMVAKNETIKNTLCSS